MNDPLERFLDGESLLPENAPLENEDLAELAEDPDLEALELLEEL